MKYRYDITMRKSVCVPAHENFNMCSWHYHDNISIFVLASGDLLIYLRMKIEAWWSCSCLRYIDRSLSCLLDICCWMFFQDVASPSILCVRVEVAYIITVEVTRIIMFYLPFNKHILVIDLRSTWDFLLDWIHIPLNFRVELCAVSLC